MHLVRQAAMLCLLLEVAFLAPSLTPRGVGLFPPQRQNKGQPEFLPLQGYAWWVIFSALASASVTDQMFPHWEQTLLRGHLWAECEVGGASAAACRGSTRACSRHTHPNPGQRPRRERPGHWTALSAGSSWA